jgi:hypothetical protein
MARSQITKNRKFWNSLRKHGFECWSHEILGICSSLEEAKNMEKLLIEQYDTYNCGYNTTKGGEGMVGFRHSTETKAKLSIIGRRARRTDAFKNNVSYHMKLLHKFRKYQNYIVIAPDGSMTNTQNLKKFCADNGLKLETLRHTLKTGTPCPKVQSGWQVKYA